MSGEQGEYATQTRGAARAALGDLKAHPPTLPKPSLPELERVGTGWVGRFPGDVTIKVVHLKEMRDEYTGEFTITCPSAGLLGDRLEWGRFNLLSSRTRGAIAKSLSSHVEGRWTEILDAFCHEVVVRERKGEALQHTDPNATRTPLRYLLRPLLPLGMPTLIYGEGGTGKSTLAAAVALSVQTGHSVFPGWETPDAAPVLILDWEATREVWQDRLNAVAQGAGLTPQSFAYRGCRRRLSDDAEAVADLILDNGIVLVIVDAVNQAFGVSHQEADPAEAAIKAFTTIREVSGTDVTWLLIDHVTGETMREQANGHTPLKAYGSVAKQWLARQQFYLAGEREASEHRQELVLKHTKANYAWKMPPLPMVIKREAGAITFEVGTHVTDATLAAQLTLGQRITDALSGGALAPEKLRDVLGLNARKGDRDKVTVTCSRMVTRGVLLKLPDGRLELDPGNVQDELTPEEAPPPVDQDEDRI